MNIQEGALDVEADATAEQRFLKRPLHFFWSMIIKKWMQLRNRQFSKDPMNIQVEVLDFEADATAEQVFLKRPPNFLGGKESSKF